MKKLIFLFILFSIISCKKESSSTLQSISVNITGVDPVTTTYNMSITNDTQKSTPIAYANANSNSSVILKAYSGDKIIVNYGFVTSQKQYGVGTIDFTLNGQNLLHINGGNGSPYFVVP